MCAATSGRTRHATTNTRLQPCPSDTAIERRLSVLEQLHLITSTPLHTHLHMPLHPLDRTHPRPYYQVILVPHRQLSDTSIAPIAAQVLLEQTSESPLDHVMPLESVLRIL